MDMHRLPILRSQPAVASRLAPCTVDSRRRGTVRALAFAVAAGALVSSGSAGAQQPGDSALSSPRAAVNAAFDAMSHKQWARVAALSDSAFLSQWRDQQLVYADADKIEKDNKKKHQKQYGLPKCVQKYFESQ